MKDAEIDIQRGEEGVPGEVGPLEPEDQDAFGRPGKVMLSRSPLRQQQQQQHIFIVPSRISPHRVAGLLPDASTPSTNPEDAMMEKPRDRH